MKKVVNQNNTMQYNVFFPIERQFFFIENIAQIFKKKTIIHSVFKLLTVTVAFTFLCGPIKTNKRSDFLISEHQNIK